MMNKENSTVSQALPALVHVNRQDFFHLLHALIKFHGSDDEITALNQKKLTIKPRSSLSFPARDVDSVEVEGSKIVMKCQFMGLYGVDSPLPLYFNQGCLGESDSAEVMRDFLDILNHRNYVLYYMAWRSFCPEAAIDSGDLAYIDLVQGIAGHLVDKESLSLANCIGQSNSASLYTLINYFLPGIPARIHESLLKWVKVDNLSPLGSEWDCCLGENTLLGERIVDFSRAIQIDIGPMDWDKARDLMPQQALANKLSGMLGGILESSIEAQLNILINIEQPQCRLGQSEARLGWQTWLGDWPGKEYSICRSLKC